MGSSSFNLPNVERALTEMEGGPTAHNINVRDEGARKAPSRTSARAPNAGLTVPSSGTGSAGRSPVTSPTLSSSPSSGPTQHEVLQNFFASLLSSKDRPSGSSRTNSSTAKPNGSTTSTPTTTTAPGPPAPPNGSEGATNEGS